MDAEEMCDKQTTYSDFCFGADKHGNNHNNFVKLL